MIHRDDLVLLKDSAPAPGAAPAVRRA